MTAPRRVPVSARAAAIAVVGVLAAAAIGFLIAPSSSKPGPTGPPLASSASSGPLAVSFPAGWQSGNKAVSTPGLKLANQIALTPTTPSGGTLVIGTTKTTDPTLLPSTLLRGGAPTQQVVTLGRSQFYRYPNLTPPAPQPPRSSTHCPQPPGRCSASACSKAPQPTSPVNCEHVIATLRLSSGATVIGLGPSPAFASAMGAYRRPQPAVQRGQVALGRARKPGDQARGANQVADAYGRAVSGLKRPSRPIPRRQAAAALVGAFQAEQRAYSALARAAGHNDRKGYNTARGSITTAGSKVSAALSQLSHLSATSAVERRIADLLRRCRRPRLRRRRFRRPSFHRPTRRSTAADGSAAAGLTTTERSTAALRTRSPGAEGGGRRGGWGTVLELELVDVLCLAGLCFGGGGDLRSGIAAFALTRGNPDRCVPWTLVLGASCGDACWRSCFFVAAPMANAAPKRDDHNQRDQSQSSPRTRADS